MNINQKILLSLLIIAIVVIIIIIIFIFLNNKKLEEEKRKRKEEERKKKEKKKEERKKEKEKEKEKEKDTPYQPTPQPIPDELKKELPKFIEKFNKEFKIIFGKRLHDIILVNNKEIFKAIFNVFVFLPNGDYGNFIQNVLTFLLSSEYTSAPDYYIKNVSNLEVLSFEYDDTNNEIEYTCEGGKSYITFNAILNTFDDTIEDPTKRNIIINAIIQIYLTYKMFNAEQNMDIRWKLPVKIKIEVFKNINDNTMSLNLNNYEIGINFTGQALGNCFMYFLLYHIQMKAGTLPNKFLKSFFANLLKGTDLFETIIIPGLYYLPSAISTTGSYIKNKLPPIDEIAVPFMETLSNIFSNTQYNYMNADNLYRQLEEGRWLENYDDKKLLFGSKIVSEWRKMCAKKFTSTGYQLTNLPLRLGCYMLLDGPTIVKGIYETIKDYYIYPGVYGTFYGAVLSNQIKHVVICEIIYFILIEIIFFMIALSFFFTGLTISSVNDTKTSVPPNFVDTAFKCNYCTYNDDSCKNATHIPQPPIDPCAECQLKTAKLEKIIIDTADQLIKEKMTEETKLKFLNLKLNRVKNINTECVSECNVSKCGQTDNCGKYCFVKYINQVYEPRVTWNFTFDNKTMSYMLDANTINNQIITLKNMDNDESKNILFLYKNNIMSIYQGYDFVKTYDEFYYDFQTFMYKSVNNDGLILYPTNCNNDCLSFQEDDNNCGKCGNKCADCERCCKGKCIDTNMDNNNCGGCGQICPPNTYCSDGRCKKNRDENGDCVKGWSGDDCEISNVCNNNGLLDENKKCVCVFPWTGDECNQCPAQYKDCNTFECTDCYDGPNCQYTRELCQNHGCPKYDIDSKTLSCVCDTGYAGKNCQNKLDLTR